MVGPLAIPTAPPLDMIEWARSQMVAICALPSEAFGHRASSIGERIEQVRAFDQWTKAEAARLGFVLSLAPPAAP